MSVEPSGRYKVPPATDFILLRRNESGFPDKLQSPICSLLPSVTQLQDISHFSQFCGSGIPAGLCWVVLLLHGVLAGLTLPSRSSLPSCRGR